MALPNDSIAVTPGTGATVATHLVDSKEFQVVMIADSSGHLQKSNPAYRLVLPSQAVGASKLYLDLFNASGSGKIMNILAIYAYVDNDTAVTGTVGVQLSLFRTTAVGTGGTAATTNGTVDTAATISSFDTNNPDLPSQVTARLNPTGGATKGAWLGSRWVFTEETNAASAIAGTVGAVFIRNEGADLIVREGQGIRIDQGTVASVGNVAFEINFELI